MKLVETQHIFSQELSHMIFVGIDVASQKHDCCIINHTGAVLVRNYTFKNNKEGFQSLLSTIGGYCVGAPTEGARIGLESTGHYSQNLLHFLSAVGFETYTFNPLQVNLARKSQSLRKTKTDKVDAQFIAHMLMTVDNKPYTSASYHTSELKSLTRFRSRLVSERSRFKISAKRLITILFPEVLDVFSDLFCSSATALLSELPSAKRIAACNLTHLTSILDKASRGRFKRDKAVQIKELAKVSIGSGNLADSLELQMTLKSVSFFGEQISQVDAEIKRIMIEADSPILSVPGISFTLGAIILAEIGDISRFKNPAKLLAFAGLEPSTYQSGNFKAASTSMVKRGSPYLRYAILFAARLISTFDVTFKAYFHKKISEGKHYNVAISHVGKKLVRVLFHLLSNNSPFAPLAS